MILALDIGTNLGVYVEGNAPQTISLGKGDERFFNFWKFLKENRFHYDVIVYEQAAFQQGNAIPIYHGLIGVLKAFSLYKSIPLQGIPVGTIKKTFTGKGNANKKDMMQRCDELGITYDSDNAADAYATYYTYKQLEGK